MNTILTAPDSYYFEDHHHHHHHDDIKMHYLDVTKLFTDGVGTSVKCTTSLAAQINLFVKINEDSVSVFIQQDGDLLSVYYDKIENGVVKRVIVPVREVDDRLVKQHETSEITLGINDIDDTVIGQLQDIVDNMIEIDAESINNLFD